MSSAEGDHPAGEEQSVQPDQEQPVQPDGEQSVQRPPGQQSELPEHTLDRRATFLVALIAAVSALLGAAIGGIASYEAATVTANANRQQEFDKFRRGEQKQAYTDYVKAANDLEVSAAAIAVAYAEYGSYPFKFTDTAQKYLDNSSKVDDARATVDLLGSKNGRQLAAKIATAASEGASIIGDSEHTYYEEGDHNNEIKAAADKFSLAWAKLSNLIGDFQKAAREDLGTD
jgi:hypothetical protein